MANMLPKAVIFALLSLAGLSSTLAQDFPTRPLTMVIPFAAGGPTDVLARVVAARMSEVLGQQVVVENVGGAGGMNGSYRIACSRWIPIRARHRRHARAGADPV